MCLIYPRGLNSPVRAFTAPMPQMMSLVALRVQETLAAALHVLFVTEETHLNMYVCRTGNLNTVPSNFALSFRDDISPGHLGLPNMTFDGLACWCRKGTGSLICL